MDKLIETKQEKFWNPEAWTRDQWVKSYANRFSQGSKVLDAGAGASKYRPLFSHCDYRTQDFCQYEGPLVKYLQPIDYVCDITTIPLPDSSLDGILCTEVLEHVADPMAVLREFSRLLKCGGRLLLTAPHGSELHMEPHHYYNGFTHFWYRYWLPRFGFKIDEVAHQGGPGRACVCYMQGFYAHWRQWEHKLRAYKRFLSHVCRLTLKLPFHYLFPYFLTKLDTHLDKNRSCVGLMVAATRISRPN